MRVLWLEKRALDAAAWTAATNAEPFYATTNTPPVVPTLGTFIQDTFKATFPATFDTLVAQYNWRKEQAAKARDAALVALFQEAFFSQSAAVQAAQSNAWWTTKQSSQ